MSYTTLVPTPPRTAMNSGYSAAKVSTLESIFGAFPDLTDDCGTVHNARVARLVETRNVGPFRVTGLAPALDSLTAIFSEIKSAHPDLYAILGTAGMLCYRHVRGSSTPSNHAAGSAIDMTVGGILPDMNAERIPYGFVVMYGYFHRHGWFWGAGYNGRTDPMHYEWADETLWAMHHAGKI